MLASIGNDKQQTDCTVRQYAVGVMEKFGMQRQNAAYRLVNEEEFRRAWMQMDDLTLDVNNVDVIQLQKDIGKVLAMSVTTPIIERF